MTKRFPHVVNRWRTLIYKGDTVRIVRNGCEVTGKVAKLETRGAYADAYGPRIVLDNGLSFAADDVVSVVVRREGVN